MPGRSARWGLRLELRNWRSIALCCGRGWRLLRRVHSSEQAIGRGLCGEWRRLGEQCMRSKRLCVLVEVALAEYDPVDPFGFPSGQSVLDAGEPQGIGVHEHALILS